MDDTDEECWTTIHKVFLIILGIPTVVIWCVGMPLYFYYRLWKAQHLLFYKDFLEYYGFFYNGLKTNKGYHW